MANVPGKPQRKSVGRVGNTPFGAAKPAPNFKKPNRQSARAFSSPSKSDVGYRRKSVGISPSSHNVNRHPGDSYQPHNNSSSSNSRRGATQNLPRRKKGVD